MIFPDSPSQWIALLLLTVLVLFIIPSGEGGSGGCYRSPEPKGPKPDVPDVLPPGYDGKENAIDMQQELLELLRETVRLLKQLLAEQNKGPF